MTSEAQEIVPNLKSDEAIIREIDNALIADKAEKKQVLEEEVFSVKNGTLTALPKILRIIGATVLMSAAGVFLLQNWEVLSHVQRYLSFLGFTMLLSAAGFFCGLKIREDKGARTFLAVAVAIIPVHFCQLGAFLYSRVIAGSITSVHYPAYAHYVAPSLSTAIFLAVAGLVCLVPVCFISFSALMRSHAKSLTVAFILANAILLIPVRDSNVVAFLGAGLMLGLGYLAAKFASDSKVAFTKEGVFVQLVLWMPFAILVGRTLNLYQISGFFLSMIAGGMAYFLFQVIPNLSKSLRLASYTQALSLIPAGVAWFNFAQELNAMMHFQRAFMLPLYTVPLGFIIAGMSLGARGKNSGANFRKLAALIAILGTGVNLMMFPGMLASSLLVLTAIVTLSYGYSSSNALVTILGGVGFIGGLAYHLRYAIDLYTMSPWLTLAAAGTVTVLASSYIERYAPIITQRLSAFRKTIKTWE